MINLISLPVANFNMPQIENCIIKNLLKEHQIDSHHFDLTQSFLNSCLTSKYIKKHYIKNSKKINQSDKVAINNIDTTIKKLKNKQQIPENLLDLNMSFQHVLNFIARENSFKWTSRNLYFKNQITSIEELLQFSILKETNVFDTAFESNFESFNDNDVFYFSIKYAYQMPFAIRFSREIKNRIKNSFIIYGGDYITQIKDNAKELMEKFAPIDVISLYGNYNNILKTINNQKASDCFVRHNNSIDFLNEHDSTKKVLELDFVPDFSDLDLNNYLSNIIIVPYYLNYGCYHSKCNFCNRYIFYKQYHNLNFAKICKNIKQLCESIGVGGIYFIDECVPVDTLVAFANYIINEKLNIKWMVETRFQKGFLYKNIVDKLYQSGLKEISFGLESLSKRILNLMNKQININESKKILQNFYINNICTSVTLMVNYPTETKRELLKTLKFIKKFKYIHCFGISEFKLFRNSIMCNPIACEYGKNLNILYKVKNTKDITAIMSNFYSDQKIKKYVTIRNKILYRTQYLFLPIKKYSLNI